MVWNHVLWFLPRPIHLMELGSARLKPCEAISTHFNTRKICVLLIFTGNCSCCLSGREQLGADGRAAAALATAGVLAWIKMINHLALQLPNSSWDFAAVESHHEKYIQSCNSVSVLFRPTNLPCELRRNKLYRCNSFFFSFPGCMCSVTGNFQCSGTKITILHDISLWGPLSNCFPDCEQLF